MHAGAEDATPKGTPKATSAFPSTATWAQARAADEDLAVATAHAYVTFAVRAEGVDGGVLGATTKCE